MLVDNSNTNHLANRINDLVFKLCRLWGVDEIEEDVVVEFSSRMTRTLGRTQPLKKIIRLSTVLRGDLIEFMDEVICHELAHIVAVHLYGTSIKPHGKEWQILVRSAGYEPSVRLLVPSHRPPKRASKKYRHYCLVCRSQRISQKRMTKWRCKTCFENGLSGELLIEEIL